MSETINTLPLLVTRGIVIFPGCSVALDVGRSYSINAVNLALAEYEGKIVVTSQVDPMKEDFSFDSIYHIGTLCTISRVRDSKGMLKIRLVGNERVGLVTFNEPANEGACYGCEYTLVPSFTSSEKEEQDLMDNIITTLSTLGNMHFPPSLINTLQKGITAEELTNQLANTFPFSLAEKQNLLVETNIVERLKFILKTLNDVKGIDEVENDINKRVRDKTEKQQKEYFLREKLKATQEELDELTGNSSESEEQQILKKIESGMYPENVAKKIKIELNRYLQMPSASMESGMLKTYIDTLVNLPWKEKTEDNDSLDNIQKVLDEDHYGLDEVKERIIEYIAVKAKTKSLKAPIICLYGPPGVGKTSLAKSIARALGRKFVKASLGGLYDEAELRGHRRTYVGAMPGKIIKGINNAKVTNPVFLLDEIDKMASSNKGDPSSALLEILDPEQNSVFQDNYLEETYDLSNVLFIATANYLQNVPAPLRDRLELIELNSYTDVEKFHIAKEHLIAKQAQINGLTLDQIEVPDETIYELIRFYTREAGVRELERVISTLCRKSVVELMRNENLEKIIISPSKVKEYLGQRKYEYSKKEKDNQVGIVTGLAYTEFGGDILPIEVTSFEGKGEFIVTGNLGNVMKESTSIALDYVKANAAKYQIDPKFFENHTIHIHCPEGAVPKDGPSAGIAITTAIVSSLTGRKVSSLVAMTGEVNLRGFALPIGGLKEKTLAALRSGIKTVIIPKDNEKDLEKISPEVKDNLNIVLMNTVDDALKIALVD